MDGVRLHSIKNKRRSWTESVRNGERSEGGASVHFCLSWKTGLTFHVAHGLGAHDHSAALKLVLEWGGGVLAPKSEASKGVILSPS